MDTHMTTTTSIGIDISKKKYDYCVLDPSGHVVGRGQCHNTILDAREITREMARKYGAKDGGYSAVCEFTANMCRTTYEAFEDAEVCICLASPYKLKMITESAKKTDREDAHKLAMLLRSDMIDVCHVPTKHVRDIRTPI